MITKEQLQDAAKYQGKLPTTEELAKTALELMEENKRLRKSLAGAKLEIDRLNKKIRSLSYSGYDD